MKLLLIRHGVSVSTRRAAFSLDEPLDEAGARQAAGLSSSLPARIDRWLSSPALAARQTAEAAGVEPEVDSSLSECDFGLWAGSTLPEIEASDPDGLRSWFEDAEATPHKGESIAGLVDRVRRWLDRIRRTTGTTAAITHAGVVRAAVVVALDAPLAAFWRIDVAPLSLTELHTTEDGWRMAGANRRCR
jgi:broad specificity phosphatase PhoE